MTQDKKQKIEAQIRSHQSIKDKLMHMWTQSSDSDVKLILDKEIIDLNKKIDKLYKKLK